MNNEINNAQEVIATEDQNQEEVFFAKNSALSFREDDPVVANPFLAERMAELDEDNITREDGLITVAVNNETLSHFLHLIYCHTPDGSKITATLDGQFTFRTADDEGIERNYNAQHITISEVVAD